MALTHRNQMPGANQIGFSAPEYSSSARSDGWEANAAQASKGSGFEAWHQESSSRRKPPDLDLSSYPNVFRCIGSGWDRILPIDLMGSFGLAKYWTYLEEFYSINRAPAASVTSTALQCMDMEKQLQQSMWRARNGNILCIGIHLSEDIYRYMSDIVQYGSEPGSPFFTDAAACIAKESELMNNWLSKGYEVSNEEYILSQEIRLCAFRALKFQGDWCVDIPAALVGIRKEAEWLLGSNKFGASETSLHILQFALGLMTSTFDEFDYGSGYSCKEIGQMASDIDEDDGQVGVTWGTHEDIDFGESSDFELEKCVPEASSQMAFGLDVEDHVGAIWATPKELGFELEKCVINKNNEKVESEIDFYDVDDDDDYKIEVNQQWSDPVNSGESSNFGKNKEVMCAVNKMLQPMAVSDIDDEMEIKHTGGNTKKLVSGRSVDFGKNKLECGSDKKKQLKPNVKCGRNNPVWKY